MAELDVLAPASGRVVPLADVPDPVFAGAMVGPGVAIDPDLDGGAGMVEAVAPVTGFVAALHPHAFVLARPGSGVQGILVHLGIDTVQLKGAGFELLVEQGDEVVAGQPLVRWSPAAVAEGGRSPLVPVIGLAADPEHLSVADVEHVTAGELLLTWHDA